MRISISAKSAASTPPAPARIVTTAARSSYSPASRVRTSSSPTALRTTTSSRSASAQGLGVVLLLAHLDEGLEVVDAGVHAGDPVVLGLGAGEPGGDDLRLLLVVPEVGVGRLLLEVGDGRLELGQVGHLTHGRHGRAEVLDLLGEVDSHEGQAYGRSGCRPPPLVRRRRTGGAARCRVPRHTGNS